MIIFYNKQTGKIEGTIDGRIHSDAHLKMWIGSKNENNRIVVQWIQNNQTKEFYPNHQQSKLIEDINRKKVKLKDFKIDIKTNRLVRI